MNSHPRWVYAGALTTAGTVAATIFCCLPFAGGLVGAGLAAAGAQFAPLRPAFSLLSVGFLGYAFYQAYRPGSESCADGACEARSGPWRRILVWALAFVVLLLLTSSWWANWIIYWTL